MGCRLEDLIGIISKTGKFTQEVKTEMTRGKFWSGLKSDYIKTALCHKFDSGVSLEELIRKASIVEKEQANPKPKPQLLQTGIGQEPESISKKLDDTLKQIRALDG